MYIANVAKNTYKVEMNTKEYEAFNKVFNKLIFNKVTNVSNAFLMEDEEINTVKSMGLQLYATNRPKSIY
jgi:hypothetical protein